MLTLTIFSVFFGLLFLLAYVSRRRFGVLGLALCAGAFLGMYWAEAVKAFLETQGIMLSAPPLATVVALALNLAPAVLLLFGGPTYGAKLQRFFGSLLFALIAFLLTLPILSAMFVIDTTAAPIIENIAKYKNSLLAALIVYATIDTMLAQSGRKPGRAKAKEGAH